MKICDECKGKNVKNYSYQCPNCGKIFCEKCAGKNLNICPNCYYDLQLKN